MYRPYLSFDQTQHEGIRRQILATYVWKSFIKPTRLLWIMFF